ncbi:MAG: DUF4834 family protein [Flavobacteriales bacterium]|nr:DUF4834 family protein [Flavobacteriales bacterium]
MSALLKLILFLIVLYYAWKLMFRLFFPVVLRKATEKAQETMNERMKQAYEQQQNRGKTYQEGEVVIQKGAEKTPKVAEDDGEYVEFEEVK